MHAMIQNDFVSGSISVTYLYLEALDEGEGVTALLDNGLALLWC